MSEPVRNPDRLVPQEAVDAARAAAFNCDQGEDVQYAMLTAAAPHIIAAYRERHPNPMEMTAVPEPDLGVLPWDELEDTRSPECVKRWPECESGAYDPACCRFPKSCSCNT